MSVNKLSQWKPDTGILRTDLTGRVSTGDVTEWRRGLALAVREIPAFADFRLLLNLHGFEPVSLEAHQAMRTVVPMVLATHGMRPAFVDLFDDPPPVTVTLTRGARCVAFANVHHDSEKMASYERRIGRFNQRFFTDLAIAEAWLRGIA